MADKGGGVHTVLLQCARGVIVMCIAVAFVSGIKMGALAHVV